LGVNHGNAAPNVINIVSNAPISELVRITQLSAVVPTTQDEALTINGPGAAANSGVAVPASATNNAVVQPWGEVATTTEDMFIIATNVDLTFNNVTFCPPVPGAPVVNAGDDVLFIRRGSAGGPTNFTFNSCIVTVNQAGGLPWVNSKAEAIQDFGTLPAVTTVATSMDDGVTIQQGTDESLNVTFRNSIVSGTRALAGAKDGFVIFEGGGTYNALHNFTFESSLITHMSRVGIQIAGGATNPQPPSNVVYNITGSFINGGPLPPFLLGGPSVIAMNGSGAGLAAGSMYGIVDLSGTSNRKVLNISQTIIAENVNRQLSLNGRSQISMEDVKIRGPVPFVYTHDALSVSKTWRRVTAQRIGGGSLLGGDLGSGAVLSIVDSIFLGPAATPAIGGFGDANIIVNVTHSAWANSGIHAVSALAPAGLTGLTTDATVLGVDPNILVEDFRLAGFLATNNANEAPVGLAGAASDGGNLGGAGGFVPTYPAGSVFPQTLTLGDVTLRTTSSASLPFTWDIEIEGDPEGVEGASFAYEYYDDAHWDISHNLGAGEVTADVTLRWPASSGFPAEPGNLPNVRIMKPLGFAWTPLNSVLLDVVSDPRTVTSLGVTDFSPFAIGLNGGTLDVVLTSLDANQVDNAVVVTWSTASEIDNVGFHVHSTQGMGPGARLNPILIPASGNIGTGATYSFTDPRPIGAMETSREYILVDVSSNGLATTMHGPVKATLTTSANTGVPDWALFD
jgi:hypothetical protein